KIPDNKGPEEKGAARQEPARSRPSGRLSIEGILEEQGGRGERENRACQIQGVQRRQTAQVEQQQVSSPPATQICLQTQKRAAEQKESECIRANLLRVPDVVRREGEQQGGRETGRL